MSNSEGGLSLLFNVHFGAEAAMTTVNLNELLDVSFCSLHYVMMHLAYKTSSFRLGVHAY